MRSEVKVKVTQNGMHHSAIPRGIHTPNLGFLPQMKKVNKQCLLDTPRTVRVSEKTWQVIV